MEVKDFTELVVWQRAHKLVLETYELTHFFTDTDTELIGKIKQSITDFSANIVKGYKRDKKDYAQFLESAQSSLEETKYYFVLGRDLGCCQPEIFTKFLAKTEEIEGVLNNLIKENKS